MRTSIAIGLGAVGVFGLLLGCSTDLRGQEKPRDRQIAEAVAAAPESLRDGATVIGYGGEARADDALTTLREGTGELICHADDPARDGFTTACYHRSLDRYMAIGRVERANGNRDGVMDARFAALESGDLTMPEYPASLYVLSGDAAYDAGTGSLTGGSRRMVIYVANSTAEQLGLSPAPADGRPWLMMGGLPWAHIMIDQ